MIRKRTVRQTVPAALITPVVLAAAIVVPAMALLFAGCDTPYSSPNWPYGSGGGGHTGGGGGSTPFSLDTPPGVITHLAALTGNGTVAFTWLDPADDDLDHIEIWFGTSPLATSGTVLPSAARGAMTAAWNGAPGAVLYYHFIAVDTAGNRSAVVNYMVTLSPVLAEVTNLVGMITGAHSVKLTWTDPVSPAFNQADITHDHSGGPVYVPKGTEQSDWNNLFDPTYEFTVKALSSGSASGVKVAMTLAQDATPPGAVSGLSAIDGGFGSVALNWTSPGDTDVQYVEITCDPVSGPAQTVSVSAGSSGSYTWNGLAGGVTYTFTVKAVDHSGNKSPGVTVTGTPLDTTPPGPVTTLEGIPGDGSVVLTWTDPGDADLDYIQIECNEIPGPAQGIYPGTGTYTWSGLAKGASYTFTVTTRDTQGNLGAAVTVGPVPVPLAAGGAISFAKVEGSSPLKWWEIHSFTASGTLSFPSGYSSVTADYLIVAGGGGSGGDHNNNTNEDFSGGGGAGGLLYKTTETLSLTGSAAQISVGLGGAGGPAKQTQGMDGEPSAIGTIEVPGGGGGGGAYADMNGRPGGSGGGGGAGLGSARGTAGGRSSSDPAILGNPGGNGSTVNSGGSGGGAGGPGVAAAGSAATVGGAPWNAAVVGASWLVDATKTAEFPAGVTEFSRGGNGGGTNAPQGGKAGVNYGDGGSSGNNRQRPGAAGHSGVVVIRFQRD
ncbi:MAG: fibronectin type III domain-containing protein [Treponema sp.]|jgi:hypothetical protein|nr:fibronectin type III domain-containing protein [Treponema sp.]